MINTEIREYGEPKPGMPIRPAIGAGDFIFLSGLAPRNEAGEIVCGSIEQETTAMLDRLARVLNSADCTLENVVKVTAYLADTRDFGRFNEVFKRYFPEGRLARTTVEARTILRCKVEIECIAYRGDTQ